MARRNLVVERQVERPTDAALRCSNYAEELRVIAADWITTENRKALLRVAADYDRMAIAYDAMHKVKVSLIRTA
jgi:hypothetical protein